MSSVSRPTEIDWDAAHARLKHAEAALSEALNPSSARAKAIMDGRAEALAKVPEPEHSRKERVDVVEFHLGREHYAVETRFVRAVVRLKDYTPVPPIFAPFVGVTNHRGNVLPILDLCRLFNIPRQGLTDLSRLVVLGEKRAEFGLLADKAEEQIGIPVADILPDSGGVSRISGEYLRGLTKEALIVLDGSSLLAAFPQPISNEEYPTLAKG